MNDDEIPNEEIASETLPKPRRVRRAKAAEEPVSADPYADDLLLDPDVSDVSQPDAATEYLDPYAEPVIEEMTETIPGPTNEFRESEPYSTESFETTPLFQPDLVPNFVPEPFTPESSDETVRRSGLAYSIGIVFVVSVAFMLLLGWIADWMFGTKPWGLVGGIVFGSVIGFVQVVRISSRIFSPNKNGPAISPLMSHAANDEQIGQTDQGDPRSPESDI